jgi:hypothetical protein
MQNALSKPGAVIGDGIGIANAPAVGPAAARIHVAVEDEAIAIAPARQGAEYVESIRKHSDLARNEALALHPGKNEFADFPFAPSRALDVAQVKR